MICKFIMPKFIFTFLLISLGRINIEIDILFSTFFKIKNWRTYHTLNLPVWASWVHYVLEII
jgi:hypothetical protein